MINLAKIEHTPTMNIATSTAIGERFVTEEVAYCRYHFDGMCVFKTDTDLTGVSPRPSYRRGDIQVARQPHSTER